MIQRMIREIEQTYGGCHHIILCGGDSSAFLFPSFLSFFTLVGQMDMALMEAITTTQTLKAKTPKRRGRKWA